MSAGRRIGATQTPPSRLNTPSRRGRRRSQWQKVASAHVLLQGRRRQHREQHEQCSRRHLLHAAPLRVAVEQCGLCGNEGGECSQRSRRDHTRGDSVQGEREHRAEERDIGLEQPCRIGGQQLVHDAERRERAGRDSRPGQVGLKGGLVRRRCEARGVASMLEQAVGESPATSRCRRASCSPGTWRCPRGSRARRWRRTRPPRLRLARWLGECLCAADEMAARGRSPR